MATLGEALRTPMSIRHLQQLLEPASVVVIGASDRPGSVGTTVWRNLRAGAFKGVICGVNPSHATLDGVTIYPTVADLPVAAELAIVCTPPASVPQLIAELGELGTKAAIVMTAGLTATQKQAMLDAARAHVLRLLGPNCLGLLSPHIGLNASFAHTGALPGHMAFVSQSGALVTAVLDWASSRHIGFSHMVSVGERADVDFGDLLDHLASDAHTHSILLYVESIESPRKFMSAARAAARNKPVIVVKAGRSAHGVKAAASHTGALAGSDMVFDAAIRRAGMLRVDTLQELFMAAETLAHFGARPLNALPRAGDECLTLMTNGGGAGVMAADAAAAAGVPLRELSAELIAQLDAVLPATWSRGNPVDIIGDAPVQRYTQTLQALLADDAGGTVLLMHAPTAIVSSHDIAAALAPVAHEHPGRVMACWLGEPSVAEARRLFVEAGVPDYATPEEAVHAFAMVATYRRNQAMLLEAPAATENAAPDLAAARRCVQAALTDGREMLDEFEAKSLLKAYGIPTVATLAVAPNAAAAVEAAATLGYPVVLKIRSPDISHKSDAGGVALNLADATALRQAADTMLATLRAALPAAALDGFTVQPMLPGPLGQELIVGASIDPMFGPVLLFGAGGTAVEVLADRAIALPPLNRVLARELISRTRMSRLLAGYRNHPPAKLDAVCDVLMAVSQMLADIPELAELDINPLWADDHGVMALDARVRLSATAPAGAEHFAITPYPAELTQTLTWEGEPLVIRPIRPEDEPQHRAFIESLSPGDLRLRFFSSRRDLPRSEIARLTQIDYAREMAFIAVQTGMDGAPHTLGVVRALSDPDNIEAEFAIIVRSDQQSRGLGAVLLRKMVDYLKSRGTQRMVAMVRSDNRAMLELADSVGCVIDAASRDTDELHLVLKLAG